jgi:hypothetical protein
MADLRKPQRVSPSRAADPAPAPRRNRWQRGAGSWQRLTAHLQPLIRHWKSLRRRQKWLSACAAVVLVVLSTVYAASSLGGSPVTSVKDGSSRPLGTADPAIKHFTPAHRSSSSDTPEAAAAAMRVPQALATALAKWDSGPGGTALAQVSGDLGAATQASGIRLFGPMLQACSSLATAVTAAKSGPSIPDAGMRGLYSRALDKLATAAQECHAGLSQYPTEDEGLQTRANPTIVHQADLELAAGAKSLYQATVEINAVRSHART